MDEFDQEMVENALRLPRLIHGLLGITDMEEFTRYKMEAAAGLKEFGTRFLIKVGEALELATPENAVKIIHGWRNDCAEHAMLYRIWQAKETATNETS